MENIDYRLIADIISFVSDLTGVMVGSIALVVAWTQKDNISDAFKTLVNHSHNITLSDLNHLISTLEKAKVEGRAGNADARINLAKIEGRIKGTPYLQTKLGAGILKRITQMIYDLDEDEVVKETQKISLCHEIKSKLTDLQLQNQMGKNNNL